MKKSFKSGLIVLIVILVLVVGLSIGTTLIQRKITGGFDFNKIQSVTKVYSATPGVKAGKDYRKEYIAALYIEGTIESSNNSYNQKWILNNIEAFQNDSNNAGLAIFINSPGGAVYQADEVYRALQSYRTTGRKIYVYQGPLAASGGYYISCAGNKIYANRNTLTGSIGVICGQSMDLTGLFEKLGIKSETIHSGKNKNMMNYNEPVTKEQREIMQSICDECYEQFVSIVVSQRNLNLDKGYEIADGRIYTANHALKLGLVDCIDTWQNMLTSFAEELDKPGITVKTFKYERKQNMMEIMMGKTADIKKTEAAAKLGLPVCVLEDIEKGSMTPMYLYE